MSGAQRQQKLTFDARVRQPRANVRLELPSESLEQQAFFDFLRAHERQHPIFGRVFHVPNGGHRAPATARRLRAEGVRPGIPDVCLPIARHGYIALWIEFKRQPNRPTAEQLAWLEFLRAEGARVEVCYSARDAARIVCEYLDCNLPLPILHPAHN